MYYSACYIILSNHLLLTKHHTGKQHACYGPKELLINQGCNTKLIHGHKIITLIFLKTHCKLYTERHVKKQVQVTAIQLNVPS